MELYWGISKEKYDLYRYCQHSGRRDQYVDIGDVWSDNFCVTISGCGNHLEISISESDFIEGSDEDLPHEFPCDIDTSCVEFSEFKSTVESFIQYWVETYAPILKEPVAEEDFLFTGEDLEEELDEYELEL